MNKKEKEYMMLAKEKQTGPKIVVVGDGAVGKTSMLVSAVTGKFPREYIPTVFDNHEISREIDGQPTTAILYDTAGQEEYEALRLLSYPETDVFLLVFSVDSQASFDNIGRKWLKEVREYGPTTPCIIIAAKADLRDDEGVLAELKSHGKQMTIKEECERKAKEMGAAAYIECSAARKMNIHLVIEEAIRVGLKSKAEKLKKLEEKKSAVKVVDGDCCIIS